MFILRYPYTEVFESHKLPSDFCLVDHLDGFDQDLNNKILYRLNQLAQQRNCYYTIHVDQPYLREIQVKYPNLIFRLADVDEILIKRNVPTLSLRDYKIHPPVDHQNFLCSFNSGRHISRRLLVAILHRFGYFDPNFCSKNIGFAQADFDGQLSKLTGDSFRFYSKFFIGETSAQHFETVYPGFNRNRFNHGQNIYNLESVITKSFLHLVSETIANTYYPFVTEKFLYSVVTRGLFLAWAPVGWHRHIEKYHGFKLYTKLFDYRFDSIQDPVERLVELMSMIYKFSKLSSSEWMDLYQMEADTIEYNYNHYLNGGFVEKLRNWQGLLYDPI